MLSAQVNFLRPRRRSRPWLWGSLLFLLLLSLALSTWTIANRYIAEAESQTVILNPIKERPVAVEEPAPTPTVEPEPESAKTTEATDLPSSFTLDVPFLVQAPTGVWDELHEEACEEASLIMVNAFKQGKSQISTSNGEDQIQKLVDWQTQQGFGHDLTSSQMKDVSKSYFELDSEVLSDPTAEQLKKELYKGKPIVLPLAGRKLNNPHYTPPGPNYHVLVLIGWSGNNFITNDPGTKFGRHYSYPQDTLINALHDWTTEPIEIGHPRAVVF